MNASVNLDELYPDIPFDPNAVSNPIPWAVEGFFQLGKFNAVFGYEKSGKSRFLRYVLLHMLLDRPLFDCYRVVAPKRMLWLAGEELPTDIMGGMKRQAAALGERLPDIADKLTYKSVAGLRLEQPRVREWLETTLIKGGYDLLVLDPLRRLHQANENDNTAMSAIFNDMRKWSNVLGVSEYLVHHTGHAKDDSNWDRLATWSRGATDLPTIVDAAVFLNPMGGGHETQVKRQGRYVPLKDVYLLNGDEEQFVFKLKEGCKPGG